MQCNFHLADIWDDSYNYIKLRRESQFGEPVAGQSLWYNKIGSDW
jgi:hypothetical protein